MSPVCILWGAIGVADLVAAPGGEVPDRRRALGGVVAAALACALLLAATDTRAGVASQALAVVVCTAAAAGWLLGRPAALARPSGSAWMLVGALVVTVLALAAADWLGTGSGGALERWLTRYRGLGDIRGAGHQASIMAPELPS